MSITKSFIPEFFKVPYSFENERFYFRVLDDAVAEFDFEAVMSSRKRLRGIFGPKSEWPKDDMTFKENLESLKVHKREFRSRKAFAYSVFNHSNNKCLGSIYIDPSQSPSYDCEVYFWVRDDSLDLEKVLHQTLLDWLQAVWPFSKVAFPGRSVSWHY